MHAAERLHAPRRPQWHGPQLDSHAGLEPTAGRTPSPKQSPCTVYAKAKNKTPKAKMMIGHAVDPNLPVASTGGRFTVEVQPIVQDEPAVECTRGSIAVGAEWSVQNALYVMGIESIQVCSNSGVVAKAFQLRVEVRYIDVTTLNPASLQVVHVHMCRLWINCGAAHVRDISRTGHDMETGEASLHRRSR